MYDIARLQIANSVQDAIGALCENEDAIVISGGTDVLIKVRSGKLAGASLVSIHDIIELKGVSLLPDGTVKIGPAESFTHISKNDIILNKIPVLAHAVSQVGGPQIRAVGTIGGNMCNGVTSADSASTLMVLDAELELTGKNGARLVPIQSFYTGAGKTVRERTEIMTAIYIRPESYIGFGAHYVKYAQRNAMDIATLGCAVNIKLSGDKKTIENARIAFGVAAPTPIRCPLAENELIGKEPTAYTLLKAAEAATGEVNPRTSWRASREFRLGLVLELTQRVVRAAVINAGGEPNA